jgi:aldose 1-epimerase
MDPKVFGKLNDGRTVYLYTLRNGNGMEAQVIDFGGIITKLLVPDKDGRPVDIVLGFDTLAEYETNPPYFGAIIGRCGNRIGGGRFTLDGKAYQLDCNEGGTNHLHGGYVGFDKKLWKAEQPSENSLMLMLLSPDGDQGYPGNLVVSVIYTLTEDNALSIRYRGMSDQRTLLNLTNHTYFNLAGQAADTIYDHWLRIESDEITEITDNLALTGRLLDVTGTPLDFRKPKQIGTDIGSDHGQMTLAGGYDHNYVLKPGATAAAYSEETGISMTVSTDRPGVQLYTGNFLPDDLTLKGGRKSNKRRGFCLETQFYPDAINHPEFISPILEPGVPGETETRFEFSVGKPSWME